MVVRFRVSPEEGILLRRLASAKGMSVSGYLRWASGLGEANGVGRPVRGVVSLSCEEKYPIIKEVSLDYGEGQ